MVLPENWQARLIQLLAVPGIIVAYYLLLFHSGSLFTTCTVNDWFDCGQVSGPGAPYSSIGPIPVALLGLLGYALIFLVVWLKDWIHLVEDYLPELVFGIVGLAFLFTLGLTALELLVINAFCQYCLYSAAIVTIMFILAISYIHSGQRRAD
ncbi:MAG: hypothetical protein GWP61_04250 [Chloroflexi bacterium]|jgi:uncharacterized membrane protein|nr:hypothetical protein [Chloroflexota bacterium]